MQWKKRTRKIYDSNLSLVPFNNRETSSCCRTLRTESSPTMQQNLCYLPVACCIPLSFPLRFYYFLMRTNTSYSKAGILQLKGKADASTLSNHPKEWQERGSIHTAPKREGFQQLKTACSRRYIRSCSERKSDARDNLVSSPISDKRFICEPLLYKRRDSRILKECRSEINIEKS